MTKPRALRVTEKHVQEACSQILELDGWRSLRTDPTSDRARGKGFGEIGMADHLYIRYWPPHSGDAAADSQAQVLWIEYKAPGQRPKAHQLVWMAKERMRGALVMWFDSIESFREFYDKSGLRRR